MAEEIGRKKALQIKIGLVLVVISYVILVPAVLFLTFGLTGKSRFWCRLAGPTTYVLSWILFIAGILMAGSAAIRSSRSRFIGLFKRKTAARPDSSSTQERP